MNLQMTINQTAINHELTTINQSMEEAIADDWSHLEHEIDKGMNSPMSAKTHEEIFEELKRKYAS